MGSSRQKQQGNRSPAFHRRGNSQNPYEKRSGKTRCSGSDSGHQGSRAPRVGQTQLIESSCLRWNTNNLMASLVAVPACQTAHGDTDWFPAVDLTQTGQETSLKWTCPG